MDHDEQLENRRIGDYLDSVASEQAMPGGGSVAGLVGALAASLGEMVVCLTKDPNPAMTQAHSRLTALRASAIASAAADELAFNAYLDATKLPKSTPEEKSIRKATIQEAMQESAAIPMQLAQTASELLTHLDPIIEHGNKNILNDAEAGIILALACIDICMVNVNGNLNFIKDEEFVGHHRGTAQKLEEQARGRAAELRKAIAARHES